MVAGKSPGWLPSGWTVQGKIRNGRKVEYYLNVETGQKFYSQKDVIRYVEMNNVHSVTPQPMSKDIKRRPKNKSMPMSRDTKRSPKNKSMPVSKDTKRRSKSKSMPIVVETNEFPEWLPYGWIMEVKTKNSGSLIGKKYKCYIDSATGCKFYSKPDVFRYLETVQDKGSASKKKKIGIGSIIKLKVDRLTRSSSSLSKDVSHDCKTIKNISCTPKQKSIVVGKHSRNEVENESVSLDGLPSGWIKEVKTRKSVNGMKKDPYYIDPVSGYIFRSRKDALRYLETGDIDSCAIKPKKRDISELELINDDIPPPSAVDVKKHHVAKRRLFAGKASCDRGSLVAPEAESSRRHGNGISADDIATSTPTAEILEEKDLVDSFTETCAETMESSDLRTKGSKRKRKMTVVENDSVLTPVNDILQEQGLLENGEIEIELRKSKNKKVLTPPGRLSKRLAGLQPEMPTNFGLSERALRAAARKSGEITANPSSDLALNATANADPQQLEAGGEVEIADCSSKGKEAPLEIEPSNKSEMPRDNQAVLEVQLGMQETAKLDGKKPESQDSILISPSEDSWSDPCLEFAFKTLTGAITLEDNLAMHGYSQQQQVDTSHSQRDGCLAPQEFDLTSLFQNDAPSHSDTPKKPASIPPLPVNYSYLPPANIDVSNCSGVGPEQPKGKEYQTKVS